MNGEIMDVFNVYNEALIKGNFSAVFDMMTDNIIWHQSGGVITGKPALEEHLGKLSEKSNGTLKVTTDWASANDVFVAANVHFTAERSDGRKLDMDGVDLFRIEDGKIHEVWLFSSEQSLEDQFWE